MKNLLSALAILFLLASPVWSAQKTVTVGTSGSPASLDTNFGNTQDNFTEVYTAQDSIRWQDATAYTTADKAIIWNNEIYACKANHLSSAGTEPGAGASWEDAWVVKGSDAYAALGHDHNGVYLESEVDGSVTNEIQTLSIDANLLTLSKDGGTITIPSGGSASAINDLTDVNTTGKSTGKVLKFDASGNLVVGNDEIGAAGTGDITGVTAGTGLTGGGDTGDVTVSLSATNVSAIAANTAKVSFDSTASTRLANTSGANTGDQTIPTTLSALSEDVTHRLVTDTEKSTWNAKSTFDGAYGSLTGTPTIPTITSTVRTTAAGGSTTNGSSEAAIGDALAGKQETITTTEVSTDVTTMMGSADNAAIRSNIGLAIGTNVQAYDADLADLADGTLTGSKVGTVALATMASGVELPASILSSTQTLTDMHNNYVITGAYTITLSAVDDGDWGCFQVYGAHAAVIDPNSSDLVILDGVAGTDGQALTSDGTTGNSVCLQYYNTTGWISWENKGFSLP